MTLPAVLLSSLFLNSVVPSGSTMMNTFASTVRFASRLAAVPSAAAASMPPPFFRSRKRSGTVVGACRAKRSLWLPHVASAVAFVAASSSAWRKSPTLFHLVATVS